MTTDPGYTDELNYNPEEGMKSCPEEVTYTLKQVQETIESMGIETQVRINAVDLAVKRQQGAGSVDDLLATALRIEKYLMTGSIKPLTEG